MHCYNCVFDTLMTLDDMLDQAVAAKNGKSLFVALRGASLEKPQHVFGFVVQVLSQVSSP